MEQSLIVPEDVRAALSVAGWDMDSEMENMSTEHSGFEIPVIRVEHRTTRNMCSILIADPHTMLKINLKSNWEIPLLV